MIEKIKQNKLKFIFIAITIIGYCFIIYNINHQELSDQSKQRVDFAKATVLEVVSDETIQDEKMENIYKGSQKIHLKITSGAHKGEETMIKHQVSAIYQIHVEKGDNIIVRVVQRNDGQYSFSVFNYDRTRLIVIAVAAFLMCLIVIGGKQGLKAIAGLIFTLMNVIYILLPLLLKGYNPIVITLVILCVSASICYLLLGGVSKKTISAFAATMGGLICATILALLMSRFMHLNGFNMAETESLMLVSMDTSLKIKGLLICGVLISSLGALMDVAMSIASSVNEMAELNPDISINQLFKSGMTVGKDAMGTMANTLILAFAGTSLNMMLLIYSYHIPFLQLMNTDFIAIEIVSSIVGSIGIVMTVPLAAFITSRLCKMENFIEFHFK